MSYAAVFVFPRTGQNQWPAMAASLEAAWHQHGPSYRGRAYPWRVNLELGATRLRDTLVIADESVALLGSYLFTVPPEQADQLVSRTPWAKEHTAAFFLCLKDELSRRRLPPQVGLWLAPLKRTKRPPHLRIVEEAVRLEGFLHVGENELILDIRP